MNTVATNIELFLFKMKTHFTICGVIIDDIICDIHFKYEKLFDNVQHIKVDIFNDKILDSNFDTISLFSLNIAYNDKVHTNKNICKLALENILEIIPTLNFDTLIGRFLPPVSLHRNSSKLQDATKNIFNNIGIKIQDNSQTCIVCYEKTNTITSCNHPLCFVCCSKVVETTCDSEEDEDEESLVRCPVCRAICCFKRLGGCDC